MNRLILLLLLLVPTLGFAGSYYDCTNGECQRSGIDEMPESLTYDADLGSRAVHQVASECSVYTADGIIADNAGRITSIYIVSAEAGDDFLIYDNAGAASGTVVFNATNVAAGFTSVPNYPAPFINGAYLDVTAADASAAFTVNICHAE